MTAVNHAGYQVESYCRHTGWRRASKVHADYQDACAAYDQMKDNGFDVELRIMEALHPEPLTPMQYITEALRGAQRFFRFNKGRK